MRFISALVFGSLFSTIIIASAFGTPVEDPKASMRLPSTMSGTASSAKGEEFEAATKSIKEFRFKDGIHEFGGAEVPHFETLLTLVKKETELDSRFKVPHYKPRNALDGALSQYRASTRFTSKEESYTVQFLMQKAGAAMQIINYSIIPERR